jgi:hypothetical protein
VDWDVKKRMIPSKVTEVDLKPQPIVVKPVEKEVRETLIQVPNAEMATQAMEMAINLESRIFELKLFLLGKVDIER